MQAELPSTEQILTQQFQALDKDASGKISVEELLEQMPSIQRAGAVAILTAMDIDLDGQLDLTEFLRFHLAGVAQGTQTDT